MFGVIRAVFLRPLPFPEPDRLVTAAGKVTRSGTSPANE